MSSVYGSKVVVSLFGESHGSAIGCVVDGLPAGLKLDSAFIEKRLKQRQRGAFAILGYGRDDGPNCEDLLSKLATPRQESPAYEVLSGLRDDDRLKGSPLAVIFRNGDVRSSDYSRVCDIYRPGHADYVSSVKYGGFADIAGGGHFSGRLSAPLVFAGALCEQLISEKGVGISARVRSIGGVSVDDVEALEALVEELEKTGDSAGALVDIRIEGMPVGAGEPFFNGLDSELASALYAVPGVKGVEIGTGFKMAEMKGSQVVDSFYLGEDLKVKTKSNHNGGINGGLANGMPIEIAVAVKPTSGIAQQIETLNFKTMKQDVLDLSGGRHDRCIGTRAIVALVAMTAIALTNILN